MNKISAIIFILNKLDGGTVTTKGLAEELNVSTKSIQRYIREIENAEFPLYNPQKGAYAFSEGFSLQKMLLSDTEAGLLVLLNSFVDSLKNKKIDKSFDIFRKRILSENTDSPFFIKFQTGPKYEITEKTKTIEKAIKENEYLTIESVYNKKIQNLKPIKIAYFEGFWYLICLLGQKNKVLKYDINNIKTITPMNKQFEITKDITKILKESTNIYFEMERKIKVTLFAAKKAAKYFKVKKYFPLQKITKENKDGSLILECKIAKEEEILPTIFHWLPYVKVMEPKWLDDTIRKILKQY
ncbi:MAG: WYL domain-containing protein [Elusimicrobia bacterium]|nr:WYL domain-containing protein [Elusimicrobiota bacterium]